MFACVVVKYRFKCLNDEFSSRYLDKAAEIRDLENFTAIFHDLCNCVDTMNRINTSQLLLLIPNILVSFSQFFVFSLLQFFLQNCSNLQVKSVLSAFGIVEEIMKPSDFFYWVLYFNCLNIVIHYYLIISIVHSGAGLHSEGKKIVEIASLVMNKPGYDVRQKIDLFSS